MTCKKIRKKTSSGGFTLIEVLVAVAIIGLAASVLVASTRQARAKARDARRMSDLAQAKTALNMYYDKYQNWMQTGSGCGSAGNGTGWFNYMSGTYPKSMARCLVDEKFAPQEIKDPSGDVTSTPTARYTYMKYWCTAGNRTRAFLYAKLETRPQSSTATDGTCCAACDTSYGMNYYLQVD